MNDNDRKEARQIAVDVVRVALSKLLDGARENESGTVLECDVAAALSALSTPEAPAEHDTITYGGTGLCPHRIAGGERGRCSQCAERAAPFVVKLISDLDHDMIAVDLLGACWAVAAFALPVVALVREVWP